MILWTRRKPADFAEVLAELERAQAPEPSTRGHPDPADDRPSAGAAETAPSPVSSPARSGTRLARLLPGFPWRRLRASEVPDAHAAAAYAQEAAERPLPDEPPPVAPQPLPRSLPKSENEVIAEELGLGRALGKAELLELRREFARKNHPDRCPPAKRPRAARRMSIANMLIDAELKRLQRQ